MKTLFPCLCLLATTAFAGADMRAFPNGEFEDQSKFGKVGELAEILPSCGLNGSAGIRIRPNQALGEGRNHEFRLPSTFTPKLGQKYIFSVVRKPHGKVRLHLAWQCWKKGWCLGQCWNSKVTPLDGGWERQEVVLYFNDPEWLGGEFRYLLVVGTPSAEKVVDPEGWVDYDCAQIREDEPEWHFANVWPTHNKVFNEQGRMRFHSGFVGHYVPEGGTAEYQLTLLDKNGNELARQTVTPPAATFTATFGRLDYRGPAKVVAKLSDAVSRKICGQKELAVEVTPTFKPGPGEVFITESGDTLIDGKPFMPLGFYTSFGNAGKADLEKTKAELKKIREAGFNCIMEYWMTSWTGDKLPAFYQALRDNDIKLLFNFSGGYRGPVEPHLARAKVQVEAGAPLLGWYILDEAEFSHLPALRRLRNGLNRLTPGVPTWQVNIRDIEPYLDVADVLGGDHYLIGRHQGVLKHMNKYLTLAESCRAATMWYCPQCFNWANYQGNCLNDRDRYLKQDDEPTVNEMLAIAFLYASHGVKGFIFYMYSDIFRGPVPEKYEQRWNDVKEVGRVVKSLEPFVLSGRPIEEIPVVDVRGKTRAVVMTDGTGRKIVLVIGLDYENEAKVMLPESCRTLTPCFGNLQKKGDTWIYKTGRRSCGLMR